MLAPIVKMCVRQLELGNTLTWSFNDQQNSPQHLARHKASVSHPNDCTVGPNV